MSYYGNNYYEREVVRESPCDSYSGCNRVEPDYGRPGYPIGHHHHHNNNSIVTDVVYESSTIPSYGHHHHHHHHGGPEIVERKEETIIYENDYEPYRRIY
ncbi:Chitin synthase C [Bienertia sinuspersici]